MSSPEVEIAKLQERVRALESDINRMSVAVGKLTETLHSVDDDAKKMRFLLVVLGAIGMIIAWVISIADKLLAWAR